MLRDKLFQFLWLRGNIVCRATAITLEVTFRHDEVLGQGDLLSSFSFAPALEVTDITGVPFKFAVPNGKLSLGGKLLVGLLGSPIFLVIEVGL